MDHSHNALPDGTLHILLLFYISDNAEPEITGDPEDKKEKLRRKEELEKMHHQELYKTLIQSFVGLTKLD